MYDEVRERQKETEEEKSEQEDDQEAEEAVAQDAKVQEADEKADKSVWLDTNVILFGLKRRSSSTHPPPSQYDLTRA